MAKVLVVYYSRTGYTRRMASEIAKGCGADLEEIRDTVKRAGILGYLRSGLESVRKEQPAIAAATADLSAYDDVVLGTPVWAGSMASPVRSWLGAHAAELRRVAFFCTKGGKGEQRVFDDLAALCGRESVATLMLTDTEIDHGKYAERLRHFIAAIAAAPTRL